MTFKTLRIIAMAAAIATGGAVAAQAASDDQIQYRDGQPVQGGAAAGGAPSSGEAMPAKPMKQKMGKAHKGKHMKKHGKRSPSVKNLRGHSENPRPKL